VGLTKLLVVTQLTCGPNEAPGRNKVVWSFIRGPNEALGRSQVMRSFTCGPNEAPGRSLVVWSFTCGPNEALSRSLVMWPWVFVCGFMLLKCIRKLYGSHGVLCSFIIYILKNLVLHYPSKYFRLLQGR
jgi:hypothetical protein